MFCCVSAAAELRVDQACLEENAKECLNTVARTVLYHDSDLHVTKAQRQKACATCVNLTKDFLLTHLEYKSHPCHGHRPTNHEVESRAESSAADLGFSFSAYK